MRRRRYEASRWPPLMSNVRPQGMDHAEQSIWHLKKLLDITEDLAEEGVALFGYEYHPLRVWQFLHRVWKTSLSRSVPVGRKGINLVCELLETDQPKRSDRMDPRRRP